MPIAPPILDDLRYDRVRDLLVSRIPLYTPEWTDHNDSDPGITFIQLFAWLADQLGYRLNRVPEATYVQFLRLLGTQLRPAEAAITQLSFLLTAPETRRAFVIPAASRATARVAEPVVFETDRELDVVPAQPAAIVSARSDDLRRVAVAGERAPDPSIAGTDVSDWIDARLRVLWDGRRPTLQKMPAQPLALERPEDHRHLFIGLIFNADRTPAAGFLGQRVMLHLHLDDEQPNPLAHALCGAAALGLDSVRRAEYAWYRPPHSRGARGRWEPLRVIADTTGDWTRSGSLRLDVPVELGPIPDLEWVPVVPAQTPGGGDFVRADAKPDPAVPHPLTKGAIRAADSTLRRDFSVPITGWLRVRLPDAAALSSQRLRQLSFNVTSATHAKTIVRELLGRGTGRPAQAAQLAFGHVLADTLELAVRDPADGLLHGWERVDDLHAAGPEAPVYLLDPEAGAIRFGDGRNGRPPAVDQEIVALRYRAGGGRLGELAPATITQASSGADEVTNPVAATGGKDAETLDEAKERAPRDLKVLGRAVTVADYEHLALHTPGLRVGRAVVVPLRRPYADPDMHGPGLDHARVAAGALSVIVVPEDPGAHPMPTDGALERVCRWLDRHRLVTTEVHVVSPQYVRLFGWRIEVRPAPGYSRTTLALGIGERLNEQLHVLRGGREGAGSPFGGAIHHADLVALVLRAPGVDRVTALRVSADGRESDASPGAPVRWRGDRALVQVLTACPAAAGETQALTLAPDEAVFVDGADLIVTIAEEPA